MTQAEITKFSISEGTGVDLNFQEREEIIAALKEENERLLGKVRCLDEEAAGFTFPQNFEAGYSQSQHFNTDYPPTLDDKDNTEDAPLEPRRCESTQ